MYALTVFALISAIHIATCALVGRLFGIPIRHISYGLGPKILSIGILAFRLLPFGGYVQFLDTRAEGVLDDSPPNAFNHQPTVTQLIVLLSGPVTLLSVSTAISPEHGVQYFINGFHQIIIGAVFPFTSGQELLHALFTVAGKNSYWSIFAIFGAKMAALNLLPFSVFNGGQAVITLAKRGKPRASWEDKINLILLIPCLLLAGLWLLALAKYLYLFW